MVRGIILDSGGGNCDLFHPSQLKVLGKFINFKSYCYVISVPFFNKISNDYSNLCTAK